MEQKLTIDERQIVRSLDRLGYYLSQQQLDPCVPALYYSANLLQKHVQAHGADKVNSNLFMEFRKELDTFVKRDLWKLVMIVLIKKKPKKEIVQETIGIVNSPFFVECLRSDVYEAGRSQSLQAGSLESNTRDRNMLLATEKYQFGIPNNLLRDGIQNTKRNKQSNIKTESQRQSMPSMLPENSHLSKLQKSPLTSQLLSQWKQIQVCYQQHRLDQAMSRLTAFRSNSNPDNLSIHQKKFGQTIQMQYQAMIQFYKEFDQSGWIFDKEQGGVRLEYKMYEQQKQIAIRIQGQFDVPVQNFLAIVCEIDLMGEYVPFCYDAKQVKCISRNQRIGTSKIYIPMLTDRETYFYATGYDRLSVTNSIFFYSKTVNNDLEHQKRYGYQVPKQSDYVRLQYKFFIIEYFPISKSRARVRLASNVDLKLNFLPNFILSVSARKFAFDYFKNIIKINKKFKGSAWEREIAKKPEFYQFFKQKNQEYLLKGKIQ